MTDDAHATAPTWRQTRLAIRADAEEVFHERSKKPHGLGAALRLWFNPAFMAVLHYRVARYLAFRRWLQPVCRYLAYRARIRYGIEISPHARIGEGLRIVHGAGVVIGEGCVVGPRCTIYQGVTVGDKVGGLDDRYPAIGSDVTLFVGAKVLGAVRVGDRCRIGANAVVLQHVPDGCTAVGVPARILGTNR